MSNGASHKRISSPALNDYLAVMTRAVFQAGLSWAAIDRQWEALYDAFDDFDPHIVSRYRDSDVRRIMMHPGILHSERKIRATIRNAQTILELGREHKSFKRYLRSHKNYQELAADLQRRFSHVGDISTFYFLYRVGERVPPFRRWIATVQGEHPRIREMVGSKGPTLPRRLSGASRRRV